MSVLQPKENYQMSERRARIVRKLTKQIVEEALGDANGRAPEDRILRAADSSPKPIRLVPIWDSKKNPKKLVKLVEKYQRVPYGENRPVRSATRFANRRLTRTEQDGLTAVVA